MTMIFSHMQTSRPLVLQIQTKIFQLYPNSVLYLKAEHRSVSIHLMNEVVDQLPIGIGECAKLLSFHGFFPIHRSYIINLKYLLHFNVYNGTVRLYDGTNLKVVKGRIEQLEEILLKRKNLTK